MKMDRIQISKEEQETTIVISPVSKTARIYTCIPSTIRKIEGLIEDQDVKVISNDKCGILIEVPMKWIKITRPQKRTYTEEQKDVLRERLKVARSNR